MTLAATLAKSRPATHPNVVLLATSLGVLIAQIDTSVVSLAVKSIGADLGSSVSEMQWVIDAYNLIYATLLLTGGTLGVVRACSAAVRRAQTGFVRYYAAAVLVGISCIALYFLISAT